MMIVITCFCRFFLFFLTYCYQNEAFCIKAVIYRIFNKKKRLRARKSDKKKKDYVWPKKRQSFDRKEARSIHFSRSQHELYWSIWQVPWQHTYTLQKKYRTLFFGFSVSLLFFSCTSFVFFFSSFLPFLISSCNVFFLCDYFTLLNSLTAKKNHNDDT